VKLRQDISNFFDIKVCPDGAQWVCPKAITQKTERWTFNLPCWWWWDRLLGGVFGNLGDVGARAIRNGDSLRFGGLKVISMDGWYWYDNG